MTVSRTLWQNVQQYIWLVGGIVCLFLAFIFWVITALLHKDLKVKT
ncbi:hypothetical protein ABUE25_04145, partial [Acinetobacter baumannii]